MLSARYLPCRCSILHVCHNCLNCRFPTNRRNPKQLVRGAIRFQKNNFTGLSTLRAAGFSLKMVVGLRGERHEVWSLLTFADWLEFGRSSFLKINWLCILSADFTVNYVLYWYIITKSSYLSLLGDYFTTLFWSEGCVMPEVITINAFLIKSNTPSMNCSHEELGFCFE